jgi:hypothetical protein
MIKNLAASWKTTSAGIVMIVGSVVHLIYSYKSAADPEALWNTAVLGILAGLGLLFAGDSSQSAPAVPPSNPPTKPPIP